MVFTSPPLIRCPQRGQIACPSLNVGVSRGSQCAKPGRGQVQFLHCARGTIRKLQWSDWPCWGTAGKAAICVAGFPLVLSVKLVDKGIQRPQREQGTVRVQRYVFLRCSCKVSGSIRMTDFAAYLARASSSTSVHHSSTVGNGKNRASRIRSLSATSRAAPVMCRDSVLPKRAGYSTVALSITAATGFSSLANTFRP